jgi:TIR domain
LLARFGGATELPLREQVAQGMVNKGITLGSLGRSEDAIATYNGLLARFGTASELPLREQIAEALVNKGSALAVLHRSEEETAVYRDLLARFGTASESSLRQKIAAVSSKLAKPSIEEWYVSYAWGDDRSPEGRRREEIVDRLCIAAENQGLRILRDKVMLSLGDSISAFMRRIGQSDRVFVTLSDKYLRSPHCMFELSEIWRTSRQDEKAFLDRVRVFALPDANISRPLEWANWAVHWKKEYDELESLAHQHGSVVLGGTGYRRLTQMGTFYHQVADILGALADIVQPRTFEQLENYGFNDLPPSR